MKNKEYVDTITTLELNKNNNVDSVYEYVSIEKTDTSKRDAVGNNPASIFTKSIEIADRKTSRMNGLERFTSAAKVDAYDRIIENLNYAIPNFETENTYVEFKGLFFCSKGNLVHKESYFIKFITFSNRESAVKEVEEFFRNLLLDGKNQDNEEIKKDSLKRLEHK